MGRRMKWLDNELYIRIAGALLLVSPFFNFFLSVAANNNIPDKWDPSQLWKIFLAATTLQWILRISKVVVGYLMFRGKSSAWVPVLAILGVTIFLNFLTFKKDIQINMAQAIIGILINGALFAIVFRAEFRANQEVERKLKEVRAAKVASAQGQAVANSEPSSVTIISLVKDKEPDKKKSVKKEIAGKTSPQPVKTGDKVVPLTKKIVPKQRRVQNFVIAKGTVVQFEGFGHFAKVIRCQGDEIWLQGTRELPKDIQKRSVILDSADRKKSVRLKFNRTQDDQYLVFKIG